MDSTFLLFLLPVLSPKGNKGTRRHRKIHSALGAVTSLTIPASLVHLPLKVMGPVNTYIALPLDCFQVNIWCSELSTLNQNTKTKHFPFSLSPFSSGTKTAWKRVSSLLIESIQTATYCSYSSIQKHYCGTHFSTSCTSYFLRCQLNTRPNRWQQSQRGNISGSIPVPTLAWCTVHRVK